MSQLLFKKSIKKSLVKLSIFSVAGILACGVIGISVTKKIQDNLENSKTMTYAVRAQMEVDMMHDAIRGDVMSALVAASKSQSDQISIALAEFKAHEEKFISAYKNAQVGKHTKQTLDLIKETTPIASQYLSNARKVIEKALADPSALDEPMKAFKQDFDTLEKSLAEIANRIERTSVLEEETGQTHFRTAFTIVILFSAVFALCLAGLFFLSHRRIHGHLLKTKQRLDAFAQGDFAEFAIDPKTPKEIGHLLESTDQVRTSLTQMINTIQDSANSLNSQADQIRLSVSSLVSLSEQQNTAAERAASAAEEISSSFSELNHNTQNSKNTIATSGSECAQGISAMNSVVSEMQAIVSAVGNASTQLEELEQRSRNIETVTNTIKEIANQTSLLALNAAIEAARAGEEGRGFAIVADEVRKLADRTGSSTVEISNMVSEVLSRVSAAANDMQASVTRIKSGMSLTETANHSMHNIASGTQNVIDIVSGMSTALNEQDLATKDIATSIAQIAHQTEENYSVAQHASQAATQLNSIADHLMETVKKFKM